jgi:hypothetical protein
MRAALTSGAVLMLAIGCDGSAQLTTQTGNTLTVTSAGRLDGVITRLDGSAAVRLPVAGQIHGVAVDTATTDGAGAFSMRFSNSVTDPSIVDTSLTVFVVARAAVGAVPDSLVLRVPVPVRLSHDLKTPVVTTVQLRAGY